MIVNPSVIPRAISFCCYWLMVQESETHTTVLTGCSIPRQFKSAIHAYSDISQDTAFFLREVCLYAKPCIRQPHTARYSKRKTQRGLIYADVPSRISHIKVIMSSNPARGMCVFRLSLCWVFVWRFQDKPVRARRVMYVKLYSIEVCKNISEIKYEENPYL